MGPFFFSLFVFADHILATCHILNGHKESTSLFEAVEGKVAEKAVAGRRDKKSGRKCSCRRSGGRKCGRKGGYSTDRWEGKSRELRSF